jgi:hypothetical protein
VGAAVHFLIFLGNIVFFLGNEGNGGNGKGNEVTEVTGVTEKVTR